MALRLPSNLDDIDREEIVLRSLRAMLIGWVGGELAREARTSSNPLMRFMGWLLPAAAFALLAIGLGSAVYKKLDHMEPACEGTFKNGACVPEVKLLPTQPIPEPINPDGSPAYRDPTIPPLVKREPQPVPAAQSTPIPRLTGLPPSQSLEMNSTQPAQGRRRSSQSNHKMDEK